ncbi:MULTISPECIES: FadR/GntR family transcriptional regulator [unclassified Mycobacterium]|uniref:FadR/GntR family transcriptional regulator n=1 Tax=unclassified Mycobacterium TaxID=2642494 RepID=UPI0029C9A6A5|nr:MULTISPECIES: FCD domain-containing protein [unclassified Mycobacterium]
MAPLDAIGAIRSPKTAELIAGTLRRMIIDGQLADGDFLPNETQLMEHFRVSRPVMREAVRVLEADRLVEVRRGSRTGARVRVPGAEIVARSAGLLLEISGATLADVMTARIATEPMAARLLAEHGTEDAHQELQRLVGEIPAAWQAGQLGTASANLHRRIVELSGNATLSVIAGMLHEIAERHSNTAIREQSVPKAHYEELIKSYRRLMDLVAARDGDLTEAHWRRHMENSAQVLLRGYETTRVRDMFL